MKTVRQLLGSAGASPAVSFASRDTSPTHARHTDIRLIVGFGGPPKTAGEAPALIMIIA
jgi:hypothetical protein